MSKELVNKVARAIARHVNGWTTSSMEDIDFSAPSWDSSVRSLANAAVAAIQAMTPQDRPGSPERALRAAAAFIKFHSMEAPPCFVPKDEVVVLAVRARQGDKTALAQLLALVEEAEGAAPETDRTPKAIAGAMAYAYVEATLGAVADWYNAPKDTPAERAARDRMARLLRFCEVVMREAGAARAGWTDLDFGGSQPLIEDYMARLTGKRPINASPPET